MIYHETLLVRKRIIPTPVIIHKTYQYRALKLMKTFPTMFNTANIRNLLTNSFSDQQLRQLCYDTPSFKLVEGMLGQYSNKNTIVQAMIEHAERYMLLPDLLNIVKEQNLAQYEMHKPYYWQQIEQTNSVTKILFLAANPTDMPFLAIEEELQKLKQIINITKSPNKFKLISQSATRVRDLHRLLLEYRPVIVHFTGHGSNDSEILLEDDNGQSRPIPLTALQELFNLFQEHVRCVILNACYSKQQAQAIAYHVDCVIGMSDAVYDDSTISFTESFYQGLAFGKSIKEAFELGRNQIHIENLRDEDKPILINPRNKAEQLRFIGVEHVI